MNHIILPRNREDAGRAVRFLENLPKDKPYLVEVREYKPRRSEQQNRYLFGVVYPTILLVLSEAEEGRGWTKDDLHDFFLGEHFGCAGLEIYGRVYERPLRRSSQLNKQEFSDYIAFLQRWAAERGIYIPDPDEYLAEAT